MSDIYTFPPSIWRLTQVTFTLQALSASTPQSAFNPFIFTDGPTSEFWQVSATIAPQYAEDWRQVAALLRKLRGKRNKVRLYDPSRVLRGAGAAGPTINAEAEAVAGATSLQVNGLTASQSVALATDDVFGIGENLYAVSDDAASDADGNATVSFLPPLRQGVSSGDPMTLPSKNLTSLTGPTGLFQLVSGADAQTIVAPTMSQPLSLQFIESPDFD